MWKNWSYEFKRKYLSCKVVFFSTKLNLISSKTPSKGSSCYSRIQEQSYFRLKYVTTMRKVLSAVWLFKCKFAREVNGRPIVRFPTRICIAAWGLKADGGWNDGQFPDIQSDKSPLLCKTRTQSCSDKWKASGWARHMAFELRNAGGSRMTWLGFSVTVWITTDVATT